MSPYVIRQGRRIEIETLDTGVVAKTRRRKNGVPFVVLTLDWAAAAAKATRTSQAMVWIWLLWLKFEAQSSTFVMPNGRLERYGVSRFAKTRALRQLETAGLIHVEHRIGKSPRATIMKR
jgi:hypothetical protein